MRLAVCIALAVLLQNPAAPAQEPVTEQAPRVEEAPGQPLNPQPSAPAPEAGLREQGPAGTGPAGLPAGRQAPGIFDEDRAMLIDLILRAAAQTGLKELQQGLAEAMLGGSTQFRVTVISLKSTGMVRITGPGGLDRELSGDQLQQVLAGNTSPLGIQLIEVLNERDINPSVFAQQLLNML